MSSNFSFLNQNFWVQLLMLLLGILAFFGVDIAHPEQVATDAITAILSANPGKIIAFFFATGFGLLVTVVKKLKGADIGAVFGSQNFWTYLLTGITALVAIKFPKILGLGSAVIPVAVSLIIRFFKKPDIPPEVQKERVGLPA
jgi:membrane-associated PAP2 superfamily phosphatase